MNNNYIVIDNAFDHPDRIVELAKKQTYHTFENRMIDGVCLSDDINSFPDGMWRGYRSNKLDIIGDVDSYFAIIPDFANYDIDQKHWWHFDQCSFAGVIYLNKSPEDNSGTILMIDDEEVVIENRYNRLVMYKNILHRPQRFFGTDIDTARMTLTFFI